MESQDDDSIILSVPVQYALYVMWCVVTVLSIVTVVALLIPLLKIQPKKGTFRPRRRGSVNGSSSTQPRRRPNEPPYSTYNLYMVYLALIDGMVFLPELVLLPPGNSEMIENLDLTMAVFSTPYVVANMWINAVVAHQAFLLLQNSHRGQRIDQPSLTRVNLQGGSIVAFSVLLGVFIYQGRIHGFADFHTVTLPATVLVILPFCYVIRVTALVWWRGYLPNRKNNGSIRRPSDRAVRSLAIYLFRVTIVFVVIWGPAVVLYLVFHLLGNKICLQITYVLTAIQPIITFCMILTKPDVKKYVKDLVTLSCVFGNRGNKTEGANESTHGPNTDANRRSTSSTTGNPMNNSVTILGYDFLDAEQDAIDDTQEDMDAGRGLAVATNSAIERPVSNIRTNQ